jgi:O-antigen ligase
MGSAALTSGSRGGALALAAAVLAMLGLAKGRGTRQAFLHLAVFVGVITLAAFSIGADMLGHTLERLTGELDRSQESFRLRVWPDVVGLWHRAPVLGTGLGAFGASFATVRTLAYPVSVTHAESDWLQLLSETGALGLALVLAFGGAVIVALFGGYTLLSARRISGGVVVAGLVIMLGVAAQGVANYNLSVMANLLCFAMSQVLALVVLSSDVQSPR